MKKRKVDINSTEPINSIAEVDGVVDAFVKRGGYITIEEDLKIRKRIPNGNHLAFWIKYVKSKLIYKKEKIVKHISEARASFKKKGASKIVSSPIAKPVKESQGVYKVIKHSLIIDSYSDICKDDPELRSYQQKAKKEIFESWDEVDNVMFQMPTGTGKTCLFTSIISDINKYSIQRREAVKILIIAHRTELIDQIGDHLDDYKVAHSFIAGGKDRELRKPVLVASIQTITNSHNLEVAKKLNVQFIIIDEAHHALATSYKKLWEMYPNAKKLGVTATPWRMNHQSFLDLFDKLVMSMPIKDFIKQGYLAPYKYYSLRDDSYIQRTIDDIELDSFGEYKESSMEEKMDIGSIRAQLLKSYLSLAKGKKGIIYAINIVHARHICKEYGEAGYNVVCIDSKTPDTERKELVKKFKKNQIDIIVNVDIFSEGFDCPDIEFIQLARPTCSLVKYLQQVGRGLRITENKQNCVILDNVGMYSKFGLPDARRHWKYHFIGKDVDEEPHRLSLGSGSGSQRYVDLSEGTEDMELIQDDYNDVEPIEPIKTLSSAVNAFFPLFGITLGKTTWEDAKDMGYEVKKTEDSPSRTMNVGDVDFWDHDGEGIFTSIYWTRDESDFPPLWKSKGFDWILSYDAWIEVFQKKGFIITIIRQPSERKYSKRNTLSAEFEALSPDKTLNFIMDFNYGEDGCSTSSPKTLYSITVDYKGENEERQALENQELTDIEEKNESLNEKLYYDNNGVSYIDGNEILVRYPNGNHYDSIEVPNFITTIKSRAFESNTTYEIILHDEIQELKDYIFEGCPNLKTITMKSETPDDIIIDDNSFKGFNVADCVLRVPYDAIADYKCDERFNGFKYITAIEGTRCLMYDDDGKDVVGCDESDCENLVIPEGVTNIRDEAFEGNEKILSVRFPKSLETIGDSAFSGCSGITKIALNEELEDIGYDAFRGTKLTEIEIPSNVNSIGASAFNCEMQVTSSNLYFCDIDGILFDNYETKLIIYPSSKHDKHYDLPDGILEISYFAFEDSSLQSISLPDSIKSLGTHIFNGCENLTRLTINVEDPNEIEVHKDCFNGFYKSQCRLFVPKGCKAKYSSHPMFNDFLSIEEMKTEDKEVIEVKKPNVTIDPMMLDKVFEKKASTYKYFWFLAIISLTKEKKTLTLSYKDILIRMAAMAWPIVFEYEIDFGMGDMIPKYLNDIAKQSPLTNNIPSKVVEAYLNVYYESEGIDKILEPLLKNVPYRFLSPWIPYTTDEEVIEESNSEDCACLYALHDDYLILNSEWWEYIKNHYSSICSSAERSFITYLKQKNKHNNFTKFMAKGWSLV